jgi:excinuclease UvrABC ATPase subunit
MLGAIQRLIQKVGGNLIIEHNLEVIRFAGWIANPTAE